MVILVASNPKLPRLTLEYMLIDMAIKNKL